MCVGRSKYVSLFIGCICLEGKIGTSMKSFDWCIIASACLGLSIEFYHRLVCIYCSIIVLTHHYVNRKPQIFISWMRMKRPHENYFVIIIHRLLYTQWTFNSIPTWYHVHDGCMQTFMEITIPFRPELSMCLSESEVIMWSS